MKKLGTLFVRPSMSLADMVVLAIGMALVEQAIKSSMHVLAIVCTVVVVLLMFVFTTILNSIYWRVELYKDPPDYIPQQPPVKPMVGFRGEGN